MSKKAVKEPPKNVTIEDYQQLVQKSYEFMVCLNNCINKKENLDRSGLRETPERFARAHLELLKGYNAEYDFTQFPANDKNKDGEYCDDEKELDTEYEGTTPVVVKNIPFNSMCEHHLLPFHGNVHVAYVPKKKILGLSKFPRNLKTLSERWQVQERLTKEYCNLLMDKLDAKGVAVMIEASHSCMTLRGVRTPGVTVTSCYTGIMDTPEKQAEFRQLVKS